MASALFFLLFATAITHSSTYKLINQASAEILYQLNGDCRFLKFQVCQNRDKWASLDLFKAIKCSQALPTDEKNEQSLPVIASHEKLNQLICDDTGKLCPSLTQFANSLIFNSKCDEAIAIPTVRQVKHFICTKDDLTQLTLEYSLVAYLVNSEPERKACYEKTVGLAFPSNVNDWYEWICSSVDNLKPYKKLYKFYSKCSKKRVRLFQYSTTEELVLNNFHHNRSAIENVIKDEFDRQSVCNLNSPASINALSYKLKMLAKKIPDKESLVKLFCQENSQLAQAISQARASSQLLVNSKRPATFGLSLNFADTLARLQWKFCTKSNGHLENRFYAHYLQMIQEAHKDVSQAESVDRVAECFKEKTSSILPRKMNESLKWFCGQTNVTDLFLLFDCSKAFFPMFAILDQDVTFRGFSSPVLTREIECSKMEGEKYTQIEGPLYGRPNQIGFAAVEMSKRSKVRYLKCLDVTNSSVARKCWTESYDSPKLPKDSEELLNSFCPKSPYYDDFERQINRCSLKNGISKFYLRECGRAKFKENRKHQFCYKQGISDKLKCSVKLLGEYATNCLVKYTGLSDLPIDVLQKWFCPDIETRSLELAPVFACWEEQIDKLNLKNDSNDCLDNMALERERMHWYKVNCQAEGKTPKSARFPGPFFYEKSDKFDDCYAKFGVDTSIFKSVESYHQWYCEKNEEKYQTFTKVDKCIRSHFRSRILHTTRIGLLK